jgi:predicted RNase H-like HicB family nuclease
MLTIEIEREEDGRSIGEVPELPGVIAYGATEDEARNRAAALALRVIADRIEHGEPARSRPATYLRQRERPAKSNLISIACLPANPVIPALRRCDEVFGDRIGLRSSDASVNRSEH